MRPPCISYIPPVPSNPSLDRPANGMTNTDTDFRDYLAANGYDLSNMGLSDERLVEQRDSLEKRESPV